MNIQTGLARMAYAVSALSLTAELVEVKPSRTGLELDR